MKAPIALISLLVISTLTIFFSGSSVEINTQELELYEKFESWLQKHPELKNIDILSRFPIWTENFKFVQQANSENKNFKLGMTQFAHLTNEEFKQITSSYKNFEEEKITIKSQNKKATAVPKKVDWVSKGVVGEVFNQGSCGGCWAFSGAQSLTSLNAIKSGNYVQFSQQQLIDCDHSFLNKGCNGGNMYFTFALYSQRKGMQTLKDYPMTSLTDPKEQECQYDASKVVFKNTGLVSVDTGDIQGMKEGIAKQPVSIAINGSSIYFQLYSEGVLDTTKCTDALSHAVNLVGYDETAPTPYWVMKNSWGASWGENGYARLAIQEGAGVCGCQSQTTYPTI